MISIICNYEAGGYMFQRLTLPTNDEFLEIVEKVDFFEKDPSVKYKFLD